MILTTSKSLGTERLDALVRTIDSLNGQIREMQWELYRTKAEPLPLRFWRNLLSWTGGQVFMSAVCNRRVRPNIKNVVY